ncbi:hypothetical protein M9H77_02429 [Catharanthus roseus]|uniref:Uncharacterized protein n=1 Tax=Catharanthus roseus TaxID=4058 RepID=A0ACC0C8D7_CATRO|nr:hypothetical protein M9H77_02429 [Catharanthus roseus]
MFTTSPLHFPLSSSSLPEKPCWFLRDSHGERRCSSDSERHYQPWLHRSRQNGREHCPCNCQIRILPAYRILTANNRVERRTAFQSFGVSVLDNNHQDQYLVLSGCVRLLGAADNDVEVVGDSDVIVLSVKPQIGTVRFAVRLFLLALLVSSSLKGVALELRPLLSEKHLLVSVVAGVKLKDLQVYLQLLKVSSVKFTDNVKIIITLKVKVPNQYYQKECEGRNSREDRCLLGLVLEIIGPNPFGCGRAFRKLDTIPSLGLSKETY